KRLDLVIAGGESGKDARRLEIDWLRDIIAQGQRTGCAVFIKQLGSAHGYDNDPKGGQPARWPEDIRVREFPAEETT
ncbi:MAG: DUF5131 family protein, partial [Mycobacteriaceae bacterium]|nr:DUF5131 family protein [Mycobacteriaceae bacterium]